MPSFHNVLPSGRVVRVVFVCVFWITCAAAVATLVGVGVFRGVPALRAMAEARAAIDPAQVRVTFTGVPPWMPAATIHTLGDGARAVLARDGRPVSPLDGAALKGVHQQLLATGWFERVEQVRRTAIDELTVTAEFRTPFAMVRWGDDDHLVDARGLRLPLVYSGDAERPALPLIVGVTMPKPAEPGTAWLGSDVRAALNLARVLRGRSWFVNGQVRSIDASRFASHRVLQLITDRGLRIVWGGDPDDRSLGEMPAERKLAGLDGLYRETSRIDDRSGGTVDLRFDLVTVAPATGPSSNAASDASMNDGGGMRATLTSRVNAP
ncbi:MAG: hypothetical protein SGJ11_04365 [Phycisphaerae bacterium]|nr:hypothetical protein [Phycisphaerae bacterium]